jgi:hypothetical protein
MATNTILELSRVLADDKPTNANWKTSLKSGIVIEEGDQVLVKNAYVDTTSLSSANIVIENQFTVRIDFGFYLIGTGIEQTVLDGRVNNLWTTETPTTICDGLPYFCIKTGQTGPSEDEVYTDYVEFNIPAGTYSKTFMAEYISRQMQTMANVANQRLKGVFSNGEQTTGFDFPVIESVYQPCYITKVDGLYATSVGGPYSVPPVSPAYTAIHFRSGLINLPNNVEYQHSTIFQNCGTDPSDTNNADGGYIGCSNISMSYNTDSQLYQWDYLHEPLVDTTSGNQVTGIAQQITPTEDQRLTQLNSRGGIYLTNLQPAAFWEDTMGFSIQDITFDTNNILTGQQDYDDYYRKITQNFPAVSALIDTGKTVDVGDFKIQSSRTIFSLRLEDFPLYKFSDSTSTAPLIATNPAKGTVISGGHYLLDIKGYNGNFKNAVADYQYKALISSFFVSPDSYVCSVGPDSCVYIHHGSPIPLNVLEVTIINPLTHLPATNLGPNSSVYLQVLQTRQEPQ